MAVYVCTMFDDPIAILLTTYVRYNVHSKPWQSIMRLIIDRGVSGKQKVSKCRVNKITWLGDIVVSCAGTEMVFSHFDNNSLSSQHHGDHHADYIRDFAISNMETRSTNVRIFTASMDHSVGVLDVTLTDLQSAH